MTICCDKDKSPILNFYNASSECIEASSKSQSYKIQVQIQDIEPDSRNLIGSQLNLTKLTWPYQW